jgi:hypothetical protein
MRGAQQGDHLQVEILHQFTRHFSIQNKHNNKECSKTLPRGVGAALPDTGRGCSGALEGTSKTAKQQSQT